MVAIKTILLPTDGSDCSRKATAYALSLARQYGGRVVALHVTDERWDEQTRAAFVEIGPELMQKLHSGNAQQARRIVQQVADAGAKAGVPVETRMTTGIPFEDIVHIATKLPADLIIMGTHGRTGVSHLLLGSVAEKVVRRAHCPVMTVRWEEHDSLTT
jgi:nucleotide-binding universal stress UspA family protein